MATKIRGITIQLNADTSDLMKSFKNIDSSLKNTDKALKDVNKLLKFDPSNVTLLGQKQEYLKDAIEKAKASLETQKELLANMPTDATGKLSEEQLALQRNIEETKQKLAGYESELGKTEDQIKGATSETKQMKTSTDEAGKAMRDAGGDAQTFGAMLKANLTAEAIKAVGSAVINVGKEIYNLGKESAAYADDILTMSTKFGLSTDQIQEFQYMAELTDTSLDTITGSMTKLTKNMQTASKGTGDTAKAFKTLGISVTESDGSLRDSNDVFNETIAALGKIENETQRDALAMQIFGKSAMDLNPLIAVGAEGIAEYAQEAHDMGYVLDTDALTALGNVDDAMQRSSKALDAVKNQVGAYLAPVIADITEKFAEWAKSVDWQKVGAVIEKVATAIGVAFNWVVDVISTLIEKVRAWAETVDWEKVGAVITKVFSGIASVVNGVIQVFKKIIEIAVKVGTAIKDIFTGKFEFPKIKLPHFTVTPKGWKIGDLLKGTLPKLGIDWYAKGYEGMVLDRPTIFGMNKNGQLMAGGERGREIIIGEDNLMNAIRSASGNSINIVINEATNPQATAKYVANELQFAMAAEGRVWR